MVLSKVYLKTVDLNKGLLILGYNENVQQSLKVLLPIKFAYKGYLQVNKIFSRYWVAWIFLTKKTGFFYTNFKIFD